MSFVYPFIILMIVDDMSTVNYFKEPGKSFSGAFSRLAEITPIDMTILSAGFVGTIVSGFVIKYLRKNGYQMF